MEIFFLLLYYCLHNILDFASWFTQPKKLSGLLQKTLTLAIVVFFFLTLKFHVHILTHVNWKICMGMGASGVGREVGLTGFGKFSDYQAAGFFDFLLLLTLP